VVAPVLDAVVAPVAPVLDPVAPVAPVLDAVVAPVAPVAAVLDPVVAPVLDTVVAPVAPVLDPVAAAVPLSAGSSGAGGPVGGGRPVSALPSEGSGGSVVVWNVLLAVLSALTLLWLQRSWRLGLVRVFFRPVGFVTPLARPG
jgi:hypothetical protein